MLIMRKIDKKVIDELYQHASESERKRAHYLLHNSYEEKVQRLLIAFEQGSYVEPHFHEETHQWEMFLVIEGTFELIKYSEQGDAVETLIIEAGVDVLAVDIYPKEIHSVKCLSEKGLLLEIKEGPFNPSKAKNFILDKI